MADFGFEPYLKKLVEIAKTKEATEHSYYSALETLLKEYAGSVKRKNVKPIAVPKKSDVGFPDFVVREGERIVGHLEAKNLGENLDSIEKTHQVGRYKTGFPNLILTNFVEFRLFRKGIRIAEARIADPVAMISQRLAPPVVNANQLTTLLEQFFSFSLPRITSAKSLAIELAERTRFLRDEILKEQLEEEDKEKTKTGRLVNLYMAFQDYLIRGLPKDVFVDLYAQTITFSLLASRMRCGEEFNRKLALDNIPRPMGIMRNIFSLIMLDESSADQDKRTRLDSMIDEISEVLASVNVDEMFRNYTQNTKKGAVKSRGKGDFIFHFYETFLEEYNPEDKEKCGAYYTPSPVVSYIVRSIHWLLVNEFGLADGLADERVTILDPAGGTLSFLVEAIEKAVQEFEKKYGEGGTEKLIVDHVMKNFYAFEFKIAPYALGHLRLSSLLDDLGHKLGENERVKYYLTNTLEPEDVGQTPLPGWSSLAEESRMAGEVKKSTPILVVMGNPPYHKESANKGKWITKLIDDYKYVDGKPLDEKNKKGLQDDYAKFIRFAEWKIEQVDRGVIGYITNHGYLDDATKRGMRQHLMQSFDRILIINLHGGLKKKEKCPDGSEDENVFDIQPGVAIAFLVKTHKAGSDHQCKVFYCDLWGLRQKKYEWLSSHDMQTTKWQEVRPHTPSYFFVPKTEAYEKLYSKFWKMKDVFPFGSDGLFTSRDDLTVQYTAEEVWKTVQDFSSLSEEVARRKYNLGKDVRDWKVSFAQSDLKESGLTKDHIVPILYRPFDIRYTYYTGRSRGFICMPRPELARHMLRDNLALCVGRAGQVAGLEKPWNLVFCTSKMADRNMFYRGGSHNFPLYVYTQQRDNRTISEDHNMRETNLNSALVKFLSNAFGKGSMPEEILYYVYAILFSNTYRKKYAEFLMSDYPRVPFTSNYSLFTKLGRLGKRLVDLHIMKSEELDNSVVKFQVAGKNAIDRAVFVEDKKRVYINDSQYFENIEKDDWEYHVGGLQVMYRWLAQRKGCMISMEDIKHFCRVATAIKRTIEIQDEIDRHYPDVERDIIEFKEKEDGLMPPTTQSVGQL